MEINNPLLLEATGITIELHKNAVYENLGQIEKEELMERVPKRNLARNSDMIPGGLCGFVETAGKFIVSIYQLAGLNAVEAVRNQGHEETHAMQFLGQLSKLYTELQKRGIEADVLSKDYVVHSDLIIQRVLNRNASEEENRFVVNPEYFGVREEKRREVVADFGGLIALENAFPDLNIEGAREVVLTRSYAWSRLMRIVE